MTKPIELTEEQLRDLYKLLRLHDELIHLDDLTHAAAHGNIIMYARRINMARRDRDEHIRRVDDSVRDTFVKLRPAYALENHVGLPNPEGEAEYALTVAEITHLLKIVKWHDDYHGLLYEKDRLPFVDREHEDLQIDIQIARERRNYFIQDATKRTLEIFGLTRPNYKSEKVEETL